MTSTPTTSASIAAGPGAAEAIRELAEALDRRLLLVRRERGDRLGLARRPARARCRGARAPRFCRAGPPQVVSWRSASPARASPAGASPTGRPAPPCRSPLRSPAALHPLRRRRPARLDPPGRRPRHLAAPALPRAAGQERDGGADAARRPCAPTSPPSATSPRPPPRSASAGKRSPTACARSRSVLRAPLAAARRKWMPRCAWKIWAIPCCHAQPSPAINCPRCGGRPAPHLSLQTVKSLMSY